MSKLEDILERYGRGVISAAHNLYTSEDEYKAEAKAAIVEAVEGLIPEFKKIAVIPDMGPGIPESFAQGYGRGEATGYNQAVKDFSKAIKEWQ